MSNFWIVFEPRYMQTVLNFTGRKEKQERKWDLNITWQVVRHNTNLYTNPRWVWFHIRLLLLGKKKKLNKKLIAGFGPMLTAPSTCRCRESGRVLRWNPHIGEICESNRIKWERRRKSAGKEQIDSTLKVNNVIIRVSCNEVTRQSALTVNSAELEVFSL